jgi:fucose 4-O-acetylase-like acetyltransferase
MSEVLLFTLIVSLASIYAVLPQHRKIVLVTSLGKGTLLVFALFFSIIIFSVSDLFNSLHSNLAGIASSVVVLSLFLFLALRKNPKIKFAPFCECLDLAESDESDQENKHLGKGAESARA